MFLLCYTSKALYIPYNIYLYIYTHIFGCYFLIHSFQIIIIIILFVFFVFHIRIYFSRNMDPRLDTWSGRYSTAINPFTLTLTHKIARHTAIASTPWSKIYPNYYLLYSSQKFGTFLKRNCAKKFTRLV